MAATVRNPAKEPSGPRPPEDAAAGAFSARLLAWYALHKRDLPWRRTADPYRIWISEIILQQTRVAQGTEYFNRFIARFPHVAALAEASEEQVLHCWQGLGYYSRARNLHAAAREIVSRFGGTFPRQYADVLSLPGIGEYTAAAICSFAYRAPHAVVDGNVYRVLARIFGIGTPVDTPAAKKQFSALAQSLLDGNAPDDYNQAIMDFGALQCTPRSPRCGACPFSDTCRAFRENRTGSLPVKKGKTAVKPRYFNYFHIRTGNSLLLHKRTEKDIWQNLYEFPLIETDAPADFAHLQTLPPYRELLRMTGPLRLVRALPMPPHQLSHRIIHPVFYEMERESSPEPALPPDTEGCSGAGAGRSPDPSGPYLAIAREDIGRYPVSRLTQSYLEYTAGTLPF